jgi:hypothetical protein
VSGRKSCIGWALVLLGSAAVAACGSQTQAAAEPKGNFRVAPSASFPTNQRLSQHTQLVVRVTNTGSKTIPNVAVTITGGTPNHPDYGTQLQAFSYYLNMPNLANHSRPVWIVDKAPGPCGYSCKTGGPGAGATAFSNTWALGQLKAGKTAVFDWHLTAVQPGAWVVNWRVAAGEFGNAKAILAGGGIPRGSFTVHVSSKPAQAYVNNGGGIVTTP